MRDKRRRELVERPYIIAAAGEKEKFAEVNPGSQEE
jgi:predicted metalloprotease